ncbi:MAG: hypothetical protein MJZ70_04425 [Bacteroidales bacterium]|nr:hypothetical protein [Bacteroidales bacterium]
MMEDIFKDIDLRVVIWNLDGLMETQKNLCLKDAFDLYCQHIAERTLYENQNYYNAFYEFVSSTPEFQALKEKYKDRLTKPTENDNANQNNEQK